MFIEFNFIYDNKYLLWSIINNKNKVIVNIDPLNNELSVIT